MAGGAAAAAPYAGQGRLPNSEDASVAAAVAAAALVTNPASVGGGGAPAAGPGAAGVPGTGDKGVGGPAQPPPPGHPHYGMHQPQAGPGGMVMGAPGMGGPGGVPQPGMMFPPGVVDPMGGGPPMLGGPASSGDAAAAAAATAAAAAAMSGGAPAAEAGAAAAAAAPPAGGEESTPVLFVNPRQFLRIVKRRESRKKATGSDVTMYTPRKRKYLHESRHKHAVGRKRGPGGRFLSKEERESLAKAGGLPADDSDSHGEGPSSPPSGGPKEGAPGAAALH